MKGIKDTLQDLDKIFRYNNLDELINFVSSKVEISCHHGLYSKEDKFIIKKGKLFLLT